MAATNVQMADSRWERLRRYREYLDFYAGEQWESPPRPGEKRLTFNYARVFVHKAASYLFGKPYNLQVPPSDEMPPERAAEVERLLKATYEANNLYALDYDTAVDAAVIGDGAFRVLPTEEGVRVTSVDPQALDVETDPLDFRRVLAVTHSYTVEEPVDHGLWAGRRLSGEFVERWTDSEVTLQVDGAHVATLPNPLGRIPYVIFPNIRRPFSFWGESDLVDLIGPARELNKRMSVLAWVLEVSGNPIAVLENAEADGIRVGPGQLWELPAESKAYLLDLLQGGGVKLHIEYVDLLYRALHDIAETPRTAFGDSGRVISGAALEVEMEPLVQKVSRKRQIWTGVIQARNELILRSLELLGAGPMAPYRTLVQWPSLLPEDRSQTVRDEVALVEAGIHSRRRAMEVLGEDDPEAEYRRVVEESLSPEDISLMQLQYR